MNKIVEAAARAMYPGVWDDATDDEKMYYAGDAILAYYAAIDAITDEQLLGVVAPIIDECLKTFFVGSADAKDVRAALKALVEADNA